MKQQPCLTKFLLLIAFASVVFAQGPNKADVERWAQHIRNVNIIRDDWGIAHVYGKTDADAVFGMVYAQAEDDFNRVETNYINAMGRLAEAEGESKIYQDLRMKLFISPEALKTQYAASPAWLQSLMNALADGLNFYLAKHPEVKPRVIKRFEPWMALSFTEGSIGGDIEKVNLNQLQAFYGKGRRLEPWQARSWRALRSRNRRPSTFRSRAFGIERDGDRAVEHGESSRAAADQSAHVVLFPLRAADGQRRRAQRLRRGDVGAVLHLSGLQ